MVYFAATFPYVILFTLLVTGLCQEGAWSGVAYFIMPEWNKLLDIQVWQAAAGQMFFSLSVSMGGLIMYSSYNDFRNNVYRLGLVCQLSGSPRRAVPPDACVPRSPMFPRTHATHGS